MDSAKYYNLLALKYANTELSRDIYKQLYSIALSENSDNISSYSDSVKYYVAKTLSEKRTTSLTNISKHRKTSLPKRYDEWIWSIAFVAMVLVIILFFSWKRHNRKTKKEYIDLTKQYDALQKEYKEISQEQNIKTTQLQQQRAESFYNIIWLPNVERFKHSAHYNIISDLMSEEEKLPEAKQKKIMSDLYNEFASSINALSQYTPTSSLGQEDWYYIIMTYLNIPPRTIVRCLPSGTDALRQRKKRIQSKLAPEYFRLFFTKN